MNLELSKYHSSLQIKEITGRKSIFDPVRKKWLILTPEEIVRQSAIQYLVQEKGYPLKRLRVERSITFNKLTKRFDIVVYDAKGQPIILVECKSPSTRLDISTYEQASLYNESLSVKYIWLTNGPEHFVIELDYSSRSSKKLSDIPVAP